MKAAFTFGVNANTTTKKCEQKITPFFLNENSQAFLVVSTFFKSFNTETSVFTDIFKIKVGV